MSSSAASGRGFAFTLRSLRLGSGMVLFAYVTLHLFDHSLLNVSIADAEAMLTVMKSIWQSPVGTVLLYAALMAHIALAFFALYERRHFRWPPSEAVQLVLGFCIPILLANHVLVTRVSLSLYDTDKGYPIELNSFWVTSVFFGIMQHVALVVAWVHGCMGLYFWLRLKRWFKRVGPVLLGLAVLLPATALLGSFQGGRTVQAQSADPVWVAQNLPPERIGTAAENRRLADMRVMFWSVFAAAVAVVVGARGVRTLRERRAGVVRIGYQEGRSVRVPAGVSVLEASQLYGVPHLSVCGGRGRCTTCRIRLFDPDDRLPPAAAGERAALARVAAGLHVRLACQLRPTHDVRVSLMLPPEKRVRGRPRRMGEERHLVVMFVDMRGSTGLAEGRLPFDTVFVVNSFLAAVGRAVTGAGGAANQMLGDGLLGLFGLEVGPEIAARQALAASVSIARNVEALNRQLAGDLAKPLGFGIGINGGQVVVGDIGFEDLLVFTALGDPVNVAARLESMTKEYACALLVTDEVYRAAGVDPRAWPLHEILVRGRDAPIAARSARIEDLLVDELVPVTSAGISST